METHLFCLLPIDGENLVYTTRSNGKSKKRKNVTKNRNPEVKWNFTLYILNYFIQKELNNIRVIAAI